MKKSSLSKQVRRAMRGYLEGMDSHIIRFGVTKLAVQKNDGTIYVRITTERPGLIIGKAGTTINGLQDYLTDAFQCKIDIKLTESDIWN